MTTLKNRQGFTLIELLIVVVIIGILAAIAIPRFASTKAKAFDAAAKTDLRNAMTAQEAYFADAQRYGSVAELKADNLIEESAEVTVLGNGDAAGYTMSAKHSSTEANAYCVTSATGEIVPC